MKVLIFCIFVFMMAVGAWADVLPRPTKPTVEQMRKCRRPHVQPGAQTCHAAHRRWTWNDHPQSCEQVIYGGCKGTDNLFMTKEECEVACNLMTKAPRCAIDSFLVPAGCEAKTRMMQENGCTATEVHCPNKQPTGPCPPMAFAAALPPDCLYVERKGQDGCLRSVVDCSKGPPRV